MEEFAKITRLINTSVAYNIHVSLSQVTLCISAHDVNVEHIPVSKVNEASILLATWREVSSRICSLSDYLKAAQAGTESQTSSEVPVLWDGEEASGLWGTGVQHWW